MTKRSNNIFVWALGLSLALHGMLLVRLIDHRQSSTQVHRGTQNSLPPVHFKVTTTGYPKLSTPVAFGSRIGRTQGKTTSKALTKSSPAEHSSPSFASLLPSVQSISSSIGGHAEKSDGHASRYVSAASAEARIAAASPLRAAAILIKERLSIPSPLAKALSATSTFLTLHRDSANAWHIIRCEGEPYWRALLFEDVAGVLSDPVVKSGLSRLEQDRFTISLLATSYTVSNPEEAGVSLSVDYGDTNLAFVYTRRSLLGGRHQLLMASQGDDGTAPRIALDILAPVFMVLEAYSDKDAWKRDSQLRELRSSPAFIGLKTPWP